MDWCSPVSWSRSGPWRALPAWYGPKSSVTGFFVHLVIANIVGASYGLLFRRQSLDVGSALGWGVSYGFIWWVIGSLTLFPVFLGATPQWTADAATTAFPHLIGHLIFGASLGVTFYLLEARYRPWWIARDQAQARRVASRREQLLTSAPALWTLVVIISLTLPVVLGSSGSSLPGSEAAGTGEELGRVQISPH